MSEIQSRKLKSDTILIRDLRTLKNFMQSLTLRSRKSKLIAGTVKYHHTGKQLLIDWDSKHKPKDTYMRHKLNQLYLKPIKITYERSYSGHWHIIVKLEHKLSIMETFFCQLFCGSDFNREAWNFIRYHHYKDRKKFVQVLFDKKVTL